MKTNILIFIIQTIKVAMEYTLSDAEFLCDQNLQKSCRQKIEGSQKLNNPN